jgi:hypothetical protein
MAVTLIFALITVAAALFMVRFLVGISGRGGKAEQVIHLAQVAPKPFGPVGGDAERGWGSIPSYAGPRTPLREGTPTHARYRDGWRASVRTSLATSRATRAGFGG